MSDYYNMGRGICSARLKLSTHNNFTKSTSRFWLQLVLTFRYLAITPLGQTQHRCVWSPTIIITLFFSVGDFPSVRFPFQQSKQKRNRKRASYFFFVWSGWWESNPPLKLGKLAYYRCTTPANQIVNVLYINFYKLSSPTFSKIIITMISFISPSLKNFISENDFLK